MAGSEGWSVQAVERAAPDAASFAAARRLAVPGPWSETGASEALLWGRCQGSGRTPYQVSIDLSGPAYRCSCPSRKFPCKHALALLLLWVRGEGSIAAGEPPDAVRAKAEQLAARAAAAAERSAAREKPVDAAAQEKRRAERLALMDAGVDDFALWLADLVRGGTAAARRRPYAWWDAAAARLVDSQLPGLGESVREAASLGARPDWSEGFERALARWWTVVRAWQRREELDDRTRADLRVVVGWSTPSREVIAADAVDDVWHVLGLHRSERGDLTEQRTWLRGVGTGETVAVLDFAGPGRPLAAARLVRSLLDGVVHRYPGSAPRRAVLGEELTVAGLDAPLSGGTTLADARAGLATLWAENPWASRLPVVLDAVRLDPAAGRVGDRSGVVPLLADGVTGAGVGGAGAADWTWAALTGGRPVRVFGELERDGFRPLTLDVDDAGEVR